jgi:hypothetical protein
MPLLIQRHGELAQRKVTKNKANPKICGLHIKKVGLWITSVTATQFYYINSFANFAVFPSPNILQNNLESGNTPP